MVGVEMPQKRGSYRTVKHPQVGWASRASLLVRLGIGVAEKLQQKGSYRTVKNPQGRQSRKTAQAWFCCLHWPLNLVMDGSYRTVKNPKVRGRCVPSNCPACTQRMAKLQKQGWALAGKPKPGRHRWMLNTGSACACPAQQPLLSLPAAPANQLHLPLHPPPSHPLPNPTDGAHPPQQRAVGDHAALAGVSRAGWVQGCASFWWMFSSS